MLRHLSKLIWKRKARNVMLSLEILLAFVVVFAIAALAVRGLQLYNLPIGYKIDDVWAVSMDPVSREVRFDPDTYDQIKRTLEALPEVRKVSFTNTVPYEMGTMTTDIAVPGTARRVDTNLLEVSDEFFDVLGIVPERGATFSRADAGAAATPVVINRHLARDLFGDKDPVGQIYDAAEPRASSPQPMRVVGLIEDFRKAGELAYPTNMTIMRYMAGTAPSSMHAILVKLAPGTPRGFEEILQRELKMVRKEWTFQITPLSDARKSMLRTQTTPVIVFAVIAAFLLTMVAFGLFGVLWQNTTRRIPEIGLRRAIGASAGDIYRQIIAEQFLLSTVAMGLALLLLIQLPLTGTLSDTLNWRVFGGAALLSALVIYLLSLACSIYPGWRASRLSPTEALHYE